MNVTMVCTSYMKTAHPEAYHVIRRGGGGRSRRAGRHFKGRGDRGGGRAPRGPSLSGPARFNLAPHEETPRE